MNTIDALNNAVASRGGRWLKLRNTEDPPIDGEIVAFEERDRTDPEGNVVYSRKDKARPRKVWTFTLRTELHDDDDDDGLRKIDLNESGQRAVADAIKKSGQKAAVGGRLQVAVTVDAEDSFSQATYAAKYTPPTATGVDADDIFG